VPLLGADWEDGKRKGGEERKREKRDLVGKERKVGSWNKASDWLRPALYLQAPSSDLSTYVNK